MKKLTVIAAGFGWKTLERNARRSRDDAPYQIARRSRDDAPYQIARRSRDDAPYQIAGMTFTPKPSVFPAVTCVAQASLRTGLAPSEHGMISNGWWSETLMKPLFWEQSARLVKGPRIWSHEAQSTRHEAQGTRHQAQSTGIFFFQQSLGEEVDLLISPAPIHKHGGGMVMSCYTKPTEMAAELERRCGKFPLWRYWGPLASPKVGRNCIDWFEQATELHDVDEAYLYLPTLDYAAQKHGPGSRQDCAAFAEFRRQLERLADICQRRSCELSVSGDYEITSVTQAPVRPNVALRKAGLFKTRSVGGMAYPDFYQSTAFAMCDHEFCVVYGEARERAIELLLASGDYEVPGRPVVGPYQILLARQGSWCEYKWWTNNREAPDYASHVDIHNKPGYDPTELFLFGRGVVKGTHGRQCEVATSDRETRRDSAST